MLSAVFISRGVEALRSPKPAAESTQSTLDGLSKLPDPVGTNVPSNADPVTVARINAAVQIGGGLLLATGKLPRVASAALAVTVVPGSLGGQTFWNESDPERKAEKRKAFVTDISLIGGLIIAAVDTEGRPSLGWRGRHAARKVSKTVTAALPVGAAAGSSLADSALAEKVGHGLQVARDRAPDLAEAARERGHELAEVARDRAPDLADAARERGHDLAEVIKDRAPKLADAARGRGYELADAARGRGYELAEVARDRAPKFADAARDRAADLADVARDRAADLADTARDRASDLADTASKEAKKARKKAEKEAKKRQKRWS
jgi:uncharacterized membrane protein YphA (DoxX/SURF4 family)